MAETKFGINQLKNPTPLWAKRIFRIVLFIAVLWAFLAPTITELHKETIDAINTWILRGVGMVRVSIAFWGLDYKDTNE